MDEKTRFLRSLKTRGCPSCDELICVAENYYARFIADLADNTECQEKYAAAGGFCPFHAWQLEQFSSRRGLAAGLPRFLERLASLLTEHALADKSWINMPDLVKTPRDCCLCDLLSNREGVYTAGIVHLLESKEVQDAYAQSQGFCLIHLRKIMHQSVTAETRRFLMEHAVRSLREMARQMENCRAKYESLQRHKLTRDEKDVVFRALVHTAGARRLPPQIYYGK